MTTSDLIWRLIELILKNKEEISNASNDSKD